MHLENVRYDKFHRYNKIYPYPKLNGYRGILTQEKYGFLAVPRTASA
jgi:hypothetical protein